MRNREACVVVFMRIQVNACGSYSGLPGFLGLGGVFSGGAGLPGKRPGLGR